MLGGELLQIMYCDGVDQSILFDSDTLISAADSFQFISPLPESKIDAARMFTIYAKGNTLSTSYFNRAKNQVESLIYYVARDALSQSGSDERKFTAE